MQPVEPRTIVRGPAAFTMCRITSADSQPWQVRWPETNSSSYGTSLTPLIWGSVVVSTAISASLAAHADPVTDVTGSQVAACGGLGLLEDLVRHGLLDLAAAQPGDEADDDRPLRLRVECRPDLVVKHPTVVRRAERVVAVDDADRLEAREAPHDLGGGEWPEPLKPHEADLVAFLAQAADRDPHRQGERPLAEEDELRVVGHVLVQERAPPAAAEEPFEVGVRLADDGLGLPHRLVVLHADLHEPVLVDLRRDGDGVVRVEQAITQVEGREELVYRGLRRDLHDLLRMGEEGAIQPDGDRERHALVLADAPRHECEIERLLRGLGPRQEPAEVAHRERVVVLRPERAGVVERTVPADRDDREP